MSNSLGDDKPKLFSASWWSNLFSAIKVWKYGPKDWAIWNLSSWITIVQVTVIQTMWPVIKSVAGKAVTFAIAAWEVLTPA